MFQIQILENKQKCIQTQIYPNHCQANKNVLAYLLKNVMANSSKRVLGGSDIICDMIDSK